jgi:GGDEF domain-containing protein
MNALTLVVWSLALGAIAAVALARAGDVLVRPSASALRALAYHASVLLLVLVESGLLRQLAPPPPERLRLLQVLAGPACVGLWNFWIHGWLAAADRDRAMAGALRLSAFALPLLAIAAVALPREQQLPCAMLLALAGGGLTCWATVRAWTIGDRLALAMAAGCGLMLPAVGGLYLLAVAAAQAGAPAGTGMQAGVALAAALGNALTGRALWRRMLRKWRTRETATALAIDPVTQVHGSSALVRRLVAAQKRRRRTRREGALLAVRVFEPERIASLVGQRGLDEVWMTLATRIQREVGVVNPVGRYWDRCFVALAETIPARSWLRTAGLRLSFSLRQPVEVTGRNGEPVRVRVDYGVGILHLPVQQPEVEDVLDDVQRLAVAAREMRSRAATLDAAAGVVVALEEATFGPGPPGARPGSESGPMPLHGRVP